jgi:hypothetical protein
VNQLVPINDIAQRIQTVRGCKVMIDRDLAAFYGVRTKRLNEQVKRNKDRFPADFMFQLTKGEKDEVVANCDHLNKLKYTKALPYAFTEHGAIMAASVLNSPTAVEVSVFIVRAFVRLRQIVFDNAELRHELDALRVQTDERFQIVFEVLDKLLAKDESARIIGFVDNER